MNSNLEQTNKLQQLASNPKNSAWVFASAGSGKTKVLVDRLLRFLLEGIRPDKILCLTFTKVAAAEMQNRINSELANWVLLDDAKLLEKLSQLTGNQATSNDLKKSRTLFAKILDEESKIKIQTIHSFCQNLVKIFPFEIGINPNFEVIESAQEKLLLQKAQREVLKKAENDASLRNLVTKINARLHEETFSGLISNLLNKKEQLSLLKEKFFGIEGVIEEIFKNFSVPKNQNDEEIFSEFLNKINQNEVLNLSKALENSGLVRNREIAEGIDIFLKNPILKNFSIYQKAFFTEKNEPRKFYGKIPENQILCTTADIQRKLINDFSDQLNSYKICNSTALLLKFVDQILEIYSHLKHQNSFLDYNDLIIETNRLLNNPNFSDWVKLKMDGLFDHILIDESQDTNHQQWNIIKALTEDFFSGFSASEKNRTIFIVGDEKQSIYSFQGAEPDISQDIFSYFEEKLQNGSSKFYKIDLNNSFRSLDTILQTVDATFSDEKQKAAISKINEFKGHKAIREGLGRFEIWPQIKLKVPEKISKESKEQKDYSWKIDFAPQENYQEQEFLAELIAQKIKLMVEEGRVLEGRNRAVNYGDFMILLRNRTNGFDKALSKFFHKYNIPSSSPSKIIFDQNIIIQDLLAAAKFALFPQDDLNLAALLKSAIFDIREEELLEICLVKKSQRTSIYKALQISEKYFKTAKRLQNIINISQKLNCFEFFNFLLNEENFRLKTISRFGPESLQILDQFTLKTFDFCQNFSSNLQQFLDFVEKLEPEISLSAQKNNQVSISTVHSAKGLQAPIVIIPDCCFIFNQLPSSKEKISWMKFAENKLPIWCVKKEEENQLLKIHRQEKNKAAKDEYLRLLYVAMTRAENELYVGGFGGSNDEDSWYNLIKNSVKDLANSEKFLDQKNQKIAGEKFEIESNFLVIGQGEFSYQKSSAEFSKKTAIKLPDFLTKKKASEKTEIFNASESSTNQINQAQIRGKLIHKILEVVGQNSKEDKNWLLNLAAEIITNEEFLDKKEAAEILEQVSKFISSKHFSELFSGQIKCEVPLIGFIDGKITNARIDLLVIKENEILIIDYKTDRILPDKVSPAYVNQLKIYEKLVGNLYQNSKIRSAILWLEFLKLEILS